MKKIAIILNYNSAKKTIQLANLLGSFSFFDGVIVGDNASSNSIYVSELSEQVKSLGYDFLAFETNKGYAQGNNRLVRYGVDKFGDDTVLFIMNPDITVNLKSLQVMQEFLESEDRNADRIVAVAPQFIENGHRIRNGWKKLSFSEHLRFDFFWRYFFGRRPIDYKLTNKNGVTKVDALLGAFFAIKAAAFFEAGLFDERTFLYFEEDILGVKLDRIGYKEALLSGITYEHEYHGSDDMRDVYRFERYMMDSRLLYFRYYLKLSPLQILMYKILWYLNIAILLVKDKVVRMKRKVNKFS